MFCREEKPLLHFGISNEICFIAMTSFLKLTYWRTLAVERWSVYGIAYQTVCLELDVLV